VSEGSTYLRAAALRCCDLDINQMTLKLEYGLGGLDILKMYLHIENEIAMLRHSKFLIDDVICMANKKNTKIALKVKGQGQRSLTINHFYRSSRGIYLPSYINFRSVVFEIFDRTDRHTDAFKNNTCSQHSWPAGKYAAVRIHCIYLR